MTYAHAPDDAAPPPEEGDESPPEEGDPLAPEDVQAPAAPIPAVSFAPANADVHDHAARGHPEDPPPPSWVLQVVSQLTAALRPPPTPEAEPKEPPPTPPQPRYPDLETWVSDWLAPMIVRRHGPEFHWCPQWWQHAEAISRLTGLWSTWEAAATDSDPAMLLWYQDYLDHHLPVLCSHNGPFLNCSNDQGHSRSPGVVLQTVPCPDNFWGPTPPTARLSG
jgi:Domain of unknown function (DUF4913)